MKIRITYQFPSVSQLLQKVITSQWGGRREDILSVIDSVFTVCNILNQNNDLIFKTSPFYKQTLCAWVTQSIKQFSYHYFLTEITLLFHVTKNKRLK